MNQHSNKEYKSCIDCGAPTSLGNCIKSCCNLCYRKRRALYKYKGIDYKEITKCRESMAEFVDRIESRGGLASIEEVFVELIGQYNIFGNEYLYGDLKPHLQLEAMWDYLKKERSKMRYSIPTFTKKYNIK